MNFIRRLRLSVITLAILLTFSGCFTIAKAGKDFDVAKVSQLELKKSTKEDALKLFGKPFSVDIRMKPNHQFDHLYYSYSTGSLSDVNSRHVLLEFKDGIFNGYSGYSNFPNDSTDFDDAKIRGIREGETTKSDILNLLGKPTGIIFKPSELVITLAVDNQPKNDEKVVEVWRYWYYLMDSVKITDWKFKTLLLGFDEKGLVRRKEYRSTIA